MKKWLLINILFLAALCFSYVEIVKAETLYSYLENSGEMDLKVERLQKTDEEKEKEIKKQTETELEKRGIPLFTNQMDEIVEEKEALENSKLNEITENLFTSDSVSGTTIQNIRKDIFNEDYEVTEKEENRDSSSEENSKESTIGGVVIGALVALAGGLYAAARNVWD